MELNLRAETVAKLESPDMLGMGLMELFYGDAIGELTQEVAQQRAMKVFMSVQKLLMIISAGCDNDMKKASEVFDKEMSEGKSQMEIGAEVFNKLNEGGWLGVTTEKKVMEDSSPLEDSGKKTK
jgi:hypothetical protein